MWNYVFNFFKKLLKRQFAGNPIVEDTGPYLQKTAQALSVGLIGVLVFVGLGFLGAIIIVLGSIKQWF
ncbi:MAG: hypothetical protein ACD_43C00021G0006 [uncultured bacterium]|nr:MAG: hypothetical protein ACD_43C00021G0006 [uncultured bacterium]